MACCPGQAEIWQHVDAVLDALTLAHVQHTRIGDEKTRGVSGGQRKRVNIGIEVAACPVALYLDEPTSGLDSTGAPSSSPSPLFDFFRGGGGGGGGSLFVRPTERR